jgi:uncharacterized protein
MLVGVIADTHDNLTALRRAVQILNEKKVGFVIHAGDFVAPFSLGPLDGLRCPWIGVFGNNDGEQQGLTKSSKGRIQPSPYELNLDGKKVVVVHDLNLFVRTEIENKNTQLVIHGHTHEPKIEKTEAVMYVNPGEACGWVNGRSTLAIIDTSTMTANIEEIPQG